MVITPEEREIRAERMRRMNTDPARIAARRGVKRPSHSACMKRLWAEGKFAHKKPQEWTEERRREYAKRLAQRNSDPKFKEKIAKGRWTPEGIAKIRAMLRRGQEKRRAILLARNKTPKHAEAARQRLKRLWADPVWAERNRKAQRQKREIQEAEYRGGAIPEGYEREYRYFCKTFGAKEALRLVRSLRGSDLRKAA